MSQKPIVVGVDGSAEAVAAAGFAARLAAGVHAPCHLVHAIPEPWSVVGAELAGALAEQARALIGETARDVPPLGGGEILVRRGRPAVVLKQVAEELDAEIVILGGKRHARIERWLAGSTALNAARMLPVPLLVTRDPPAAVRRILVAVDASAAAKPTLATAERLAALWDARLKAVNVLQPFPAVPEAGFTHAPEYYALWEDTLRREVWPLIRTPGVETALRQGPIAETLALEAAEWQADLLILGSHGKGWVDRLLLGSVTERLLNDLPTNLLIVPVAGGMEAKSAPASPASELAARPRVRAARRAQRKR